LSFEVGDRGQHLEAIINPVPNLRRQHSYWRAHVGDILQL